MIWWLVIVAPLISAGLTLGRGWNGWRRWLMPLAALPGVLLSIGPEVQETKSSAVLLGTHLGFGETGPVFLFFTASLWLLAGAYGSGYFLRAPKGKLFQFFFLLAMAGNLGLTIAQDVPLFYTCFALMTFSAYGVVVHYGTPEAWRAGRIYIVMALVGEAMLLGAIFLGVHAADSLLLADLGRGIAEAPNRNLIVALAFFGFGVKAGTFGVHFWLPLAHPVAPAPASAVLSGAMIKAGLLGWIHFLPLGEGAFPGWSGFLIVIGISGALYAALVGLGQEEPKTILAYSSVSQMGVMSVGIGIGLTEPEAWAMVMPILALYAMNHAFAKGALFLAAGMAATGAGGSARRWVLVGAALGALAIAGAPWSGGATAKYALKNAAVFAPEQWYHLLDWLLPLSTVATSMLLARFLWRLMKKEGQTRLPASMTVSWSILLAALLGVVILALRYFHLEIEASPVSLTAFWSALWPIGLGVGVLLGLGRFYPSAPRVPPGDLVLPLERLLQNARAFWNRHPLPRPQYWQINLVQMAEWISAWERRGQWSQRLENWLERWETAGCVFIGLILLLVALLYFRSGIS
jgi:formate hydrogenlyase subunit 3/multisubunit Na+/H+ antiporter MnhD subunit